MSPEMLNNKPVGAPTDVYSAGVILYKMLELAMPFAPEDQDLYVEDAKKKDPKLVEGAMSQNMLNMMMLMLQKNPEMRLTAKYIKEHPSIKKFSGDAPAQFKQDLLLTE